MIRKTYVYCNKDGEPMAAECYCSNSQLSNEKNKGYKVYRSNKNKKCVGCKYICSLPKQFIQDFKNLN